MQTIALDKVAARRVSRIALLTFASIAGSVLLACAVPFPALATLAALYMSRRDAFILTGVTWVANQMVGYGFLQYPQTLESFTWGIVIGVGATIATMVAAVTCRAMHFYGSALRILTSFAVAFVVYETALYSATAMLPSGSGAFSLSVVLYILKVNFVALGGFLVLQYAGTRIGLALPRSSTCAAATTA